MAKSGGELGPAIISRFRAYAIRIWPHSFTKGLPGRGAATGQPSDAEMPLLVRFLRSIQPRGFGRPVVRKTVQTTDGKQLEGEVLGEGFDDLQLRTADERVHLLRRSGDRYREVTSQQGWPGYNGDPGGNRYTTLSQITPANVSHLAPVGLATAGQYGTSGSDSGRGRGHHVCQQRQ